MHRKPSVLNKIDGISEMDDTRPFLGAIFERDRINYVSADDYIIIEDSSGRIVCKGATVCRRPFKPSQIVTGCVASLYGHADVNGTFFVEDWTMIGYVQKDNIPRSLKLGLPKRGLFDDDLLSDSSTRKFILFASGFEIGMHQRSEPANTLKLSLLCSLLLG